jgi:hypothetical protein
MICTRSRRGARAVSLTTGRNHPAGNREDLVNNLEDVGSRFHRNRWSQSRLANLQIVPARCGTGLESK